MGDSLPGDQILQRRSRRDRRPCHNDGSGGTDGVGRRWSDRQPLRRHWSASRAGETLPPRRPPTVGGARRHFEPRVVAAGLCRRLGRGRDAGRHRRGWWTTASGGRGDAAGI